MSTLIEKLERQQLRRLPNFRAGDRVRVHVQVVEGSRKRTQVFEGVVIARGGHGVRETITVRKQSFGVGVERVFPLHSPKIEQIEVAARGDVRRAKLYYLRDRVGRKARVRERTDLTPEEAVDRDLLEVPPAAEPEPEPAAEAVEQAPEADAQDAPEAGATTAEPDAGAEAPTAGPEADEAPAEEPAAQADEAPAEEPAAEGEEPAEADSQPEEQ